MSFYFFAACGFLGGVLGGMGMGGGTALIPLLTLLGGVGQAEAQGVNLIAFLPMSVAALCVHAREGRVRGEGLLSLILPALFFSVLFSLLAARAPSSVLSSLFGGGLSVLSLFRLKRALTRPYGRE